MDLRGLKTLKRFLSAGTAETQVLLDLGCLSRFFFPLCPAFFLCVPTCSPALLLDVLTNLAEPLVKFRVLLGIIRKLFEKEKRYRKWKWMLVVLGFQIVLNYK